MATPQQKTIATILAGVIVAVTPALLGYLQNRDEIKAKYQLTQNEATSGYAALAASVKELQAAMTAQHAYIIKLEGHLEAVDNFMMSAINKTASTRVTVGRPPITAPDTAAKAPAPIAPPAKPNFRELPPDLAGAVQQAAPGS